MPRWEQRGTNFPGNPEQKEDEMRRLLAATAILFTPVMSAGAQGVPPNFHQTYDSHQLASQTIDGGGGADSSDLAALTEQSGLLAPDISQRGDNLVNLVFTTTHLDTVTQRFNGRQEVENSIVSGALGALGAIEQTGNNIAGLITGNTIDLADQLMGRDALQHVRNTATLSTSFSSLSQFGSNTANLAVADYAIGTATQDIEAGAQQIVDNTLYLTADAVVGEFISQSGANYGNLMIADRIDSVSRVFAGDQIVNNTVYVSDTDNVPSITQSGTNVANMIMADYIGAIHQVSVGRQVVNNRVIGPDGEILTGPSIDQNEDNFMGPTTDVVNLAVIGTGTADGSNGGEMSISQEADYEQSSNGSNSSQAGNVVSITR